MRLGSEPSPREGQGICCIVRVYHTFLVREPATEPRVFTIFKNCLPVCNDFFHSICPTLIRAGHGRMMRECVCMCVLRSMNELKAESVIFPIVRS